MHIEGHLNNDFFRWMEKNTGAGIAVPFMVLPETVMCQIDALILSDEKSTREYYHHHHHRDSNERMESFFLMCGFCLPFGLLLCCCHVYELMI